MVGSFTNVANSTKSNFIRIEDSIQNINQALNKSNFRQTITKIIHLYNIFLDNFHNLYSHLNEIETAIAFSKINVLHQSIIDTEELIILLKEIEQTDKLVFPVTYENIVKLERCIEIKAYIKQNQIKFIMSIPLIRNEIFNYYKLIPLPVLHNGQTTLILPKNPYLLVKGLKATPLSQSCREVNERRFLCYENDIQLFTDDNCVMEIMQFHTNISSCHPIPVTLENVKIYLIQTNRWIVYSDTETAMTKFCDGKVSQEILLGTYLLTMDDSCKVKIKGYELKRHQTQGKEITYLKQPMVNLPKILFDPSSILKKPMNLDGINIADVQFLNLLLQRSMGEISSELSESEKSEITYKSVSLVNIIILVIILIILSIIFKHKLTKICKIWKIRDNPEDNPELVEGGVISPQSVPGSIFQTTTSAFS